MYYKYNNEALHHIPVCYIITLHSH